MYYLGDAWNPAQKLQHSVKKRSEFESVPAALQQFGSLAYGPMRQYKISHYGRPIRRFDSVEHIGAGRQIYVTHAWLTGNM